MKTLRRPPAHIRKKQQHQQKSSMNEIKIPSLYRCAVAYSQKPVYATPTNIMEKKLSPTKATGVQKQNNKKKRDNSKYNQVPPRRRKPLNGG